MPDKIDLGFALTLPPQDAIAYFKGKGYVLTWDWRDLWKEAHTVAFTVAKVARMDILEDIRTELQKALDHGSTVKDFQKILAPILQSKGWWGKTAEGDQLGSPWRLENIYRTNMQSAFMAGRYKQQLAEAQDAPYWQYLAVMDSRTRPSHAAVNRLVFRYDDLFWKTHYPPCGFQCRCRVRALTERQLKKYGFQVQSSAGKIFSDTVDTGGGRIREVTVYRGPGADGKPVKMAPDPGWDYNPGEAWLDNLRKLEEEKAAKVFVMRPVPVPDHEATLRGFLGDKVFDEFRDQARRFQPADMTDAEAVAVRLYTGQMYKPINRHLRGQKTGIDPAVAAALASAAESALDKLPVYQGETQRAIRTELMADVQMFIARHARIGEIVTYEAFTSTTPGGAVTFSAWADVFIAIQSRAGRRLLGLSELVGENEVLFKPGARFRVLNYTIRNGRHFIELEEQP